MRRHPTYPFVVEQRPASEAEQADLNELYDKAAADWSRDVPQVRDDLIAWPILTSKTKALALGALVLDIGCGTGNICRLVNRYVRTVVGLDISRKMIEMAEQQTATPSNIHYVVGDMTRLTDFAVKDSIDLALSIFGYCCLQNQSELERCVRETWLVLRPGGHLLIQAPHPLEAFLRQGSAWIQELDSTQDYFDNGQTLRRKLRMVNGKWLTVGRHHYTLTGYFDALLKNGFTIEEFLEPRPSPEMVKQHPDLQHEASMPSSFILLARKSTMPPQKS